MWPVLFRLAGERDSGTVSQRNSTGRGPLPQTDLIRQQVGEEAPEGEFEEQEEQDLGQVEVPCP